MNLYQLGLVYVESWYKWVYMPIYQYTNFGPGATVIYQYTNFQAFRPAGTYNAKGKPLQRLRTIGI